MYMIRLLCCVFCKQHVNLLLEVGRCKHYSNMYQLAVGEESEKAGLVLEYSYCHK